MSQPIRILQVIPNLRKGGAERLVIDISNELMSRGNVDVQIMTLEAENKYKSQSEGLKINVIPAQVKLSVFGKNISRLNPYIDLIHSFKPHIIHSHLYAAEIVTREHIFPGIRYFSHFHDNMPVFAKPKWNEVINKKELTRLFEKYRIERKYKQCNNSFICISNDTLQYAKENIGEGFTFHLLHNAIRFERFFAQPYRKGISGKRISLLNIGSLVEKKNQSFLLDVVKELMGMGFDPELILLGDGPDRKKLELHIVDRKLGKHVTLMGEIDDLSPYLNKAHIYVHSATYEPFGLVLLEAMAAGLPVITIDGKGNRDIIRNNENGFLIGAGELHNFADKIISLAENGSEYERISKEAVASARNFDIKSYVDRLLEIYQS